MIIGVSGKMNAGKDTVAKMIMALTGGSKSTWVNKKYAYKLKEHVANLIGCDVKDLEDREFKDKELPSEWSLWGVATKTGAVISRYSDKEEARTALIKRMRTNHKERFETVVKELKMTPRELLQHIGQKTRSIHPEIWVNALFSTYSDDDSWVVTDVRYPNELAKIKELGGFTIRVNRKQVREVVNALDDIKQVEVVGSSHESETALDSATFDYIIDNSEGLGKLSKDVTQILKERNLY